MNYAETNTVAAALDLIVQAERDVNFGRPQDMSGSKEAMNVAFTALVVELGELMQECDVKPWKVRAEPIDARKVADEFADVMAFLGVLVANIMEQTGFQITPRILAQAFADKTDINIKRAQGKVAGYQPGPGITAPLG